MTRYQRSKKIWNLLVAAARERKSYTYGGIAKEIGMDGGQKAMRHYLGPIMRYCEKKRYPALTVLVVEKISGVHGGGLITIDIDVNKEREKVFRYKWSSKKQPTLGDLECAEEE